MMQRARQKVAGCQEPAKYQTTTAHWVVFLMLAPKASNMDTKQFSSKTAVVA